MTDKDRIAAKEGSLATGLPSFKAVRLSREGDFATILLRGPRELFSIIFVLGSDSVMLKISYDDWIKVHSAMCELEAEARNSSPRL